MPQKVGGKNVPAPAARTRLSTFEKWARRLQRQGGSDFGFTLADVSDTSIAKSMTRLQREGWDGVLLGTKVNAGGEVNVYNTEVKASLC